MPEISGDDAAQKWMWWQRLGFFKPKRLMQFGKFINTGEIGYNLCLAALYCRRRGCLPGKTTTDSTLFLCTIIDNDFCKHQFGAAKSAHQARLDLRPPRRSSPKSCASFFCIMIVARLSSSVCRTSFYPELPRETGGSETRRPGLSRKRYGLLSYR